MSTGTYSIGNKIVNRNNNPNKSWRLVHDGTTVFKIFQSTGYIETLYNLEIRGTKQLCIDRANQLGLTFSEYWDPENIPDNTPDLPSE